MNLDETFNARSTDDPSDCIAVSPAVRFDQSEWLSCGQRCRLSRRALGHRFKEPSKKPMMMGRYKVVPMTIVSRRANRP